MGFLALKKKEIQVPKDPDHLARKTIRQGLDIVVDLDKRKTFLDGLGGQHELENITYDGTFIACKLPGKNFFTQAASINVSLWKASIPPQYYGIPEDLTKKMDAMFEEMKKETSFHAYIRKKELSHIRASVLGNDMQDALMTYPHYIEQLTREYTTAKQSVLWLLEAAKALQTKRYSG